MGPHDGACSPPCSTAGLTFAIGQFVGVELRRPGAHRHARGVVLAGLGGAAAEVLEPKRRLRRRRGRSSAETIARSARRACGRAYATYGILVVTVLIGQVGNFAGMSQLQAAGQRHGVAALRPDRQSRSAPSRGSAQPASVDPQGFRFPVWEFSWPGAYQHGRRQAGAAACSAKRRSWRRPRPIALTYRLDFLAAAGTLVLFATFIAFIPMVAAGARPGILGVAFGKTVGAIAAADRHHRLHPLDRDGDELFRHDLVDGAGAGADRLAVPVLLRVARHARRVPDRQRHLVEHAVRSAAGDHREGLGTRSDPDGRDQQLRRRDGQDDQPAEPVGRRRRRRRGRPRRRDLLEGDLPQPDPDRR